MRPLPLSPWQKFKKLYGKGCGSESCTRVMNVCLARGSIPCDLLFVAEAPGESEDTFGTVLKGPAGKYFDDILTHCVQDGVTKGFCNLVGCIPQEGDKPGKAGQPSVEDIEQCSNRLKDFIALCNPKVIICVGTVSRDWLDRKSVSGRKLYWNELDQRLGRCIPMEWVLHPSYIMQQDENMKTLFKRKSIITIRKAVEKYILGMVDEDEE